MKFQTIIDQDRDQEVVIYAHKRTREIEELEAFVDNLGTELMGYGDGKVVKLRPSDIHCFSVEDNKIWALTDSEKLWVKQRLYTLEEMLDEGFVRINQSCIANVSKIKRFDTSIGGALLVIFKNGHKDYVSRRQLKKG